MSLNKDEIYKLFKLLSLPDEYFYAFYQGFKAAELNSKVKYD